MYGGLFGDLPAAKSSSNKEGEDTKNEASITAKTAAAEAEITEASSSAKPAAVASMMFLPQVARKKVKTSSISQAVGAAGTSMAFVPTTIKRKRPSRFPNVKPVQIPKARAPTANSSSMPITSTETNNAAFLATSTTGLQQQAPSNTHPASTTVVQASIDTIHAGITTMTTTITNSATSAVRDPIDIHGTAGLQQLHQMVTSIENCQEEEEITDPYDPYVPNDLLQYWDRQTLAQERATLERETREALEKQRMIRQQLETEREQLQKHGDYSKLAVNVGVAMGKVRGPGRGRGRGVSNLPAWLVKKQRQEESEGLGGRGV